MTDMYIAMQQLASQPDEITSLSNTAVQRMRQLAVTWCPQIFVWTSALDPWRNVIPWHAHAVHVQHPTCQNADKPPSPVTTDQAAEPTATPTTSQILLSSWSHNSIAPSPVHGDTSGAVTRTALCYSTPPSVKRYQRLAAHAESSLIAALLAEVLRDLRRAGAAAATGAAAPSPAAAAGCFCISSSCFLTCGRCGSINSSSTNCIASAARINAQPFACPTQPAALLNSHPGVGNEAEQTAVQAARSILYVMRFNPNVLCEQ